MGALWAPVSIRSKGAALFCDMAARGAATNKNMASCADLQKSRPLLANWAKNVTAYRRASAAADLTCAMTTVQFVMSTAQV
jgi:hypothetical protein